MASRADKEAFVTGHSGTTTWEVLLIVSVFNAVWVLYVLGSWLARLKEGSAASWAVGVLALLGPSLLACWYPDRGLASTSSNVHPLSILLLTTGVAVLLLVATQQRQKPRLYWADAQAAQHVHPKAYITLVRAGLTAYTCIAILAVDFPYFPRRLAKAETFGTGLMDIGPGMFVLSSGMGLGLRLLRLSTSDESPEAHLDTTERDTKHSATQQHEDDPFDESSTLALLLRAAKSVGPLLLLGLARMVLTKAVDYQEHHSEYGVHWNFFFTLAYVACMGAFAPLHGTGAAAAAVATGALHQLLLVQPGVSEWLGAHERDMTSFVDANKEGLVSLGGYAALFYAGAGCSRILQGTSNTDLNAPADLTAPAAHASPDKDMMDSSSTDKGAAGLSGGYVAGNVGRQETVGRLVADNQRIHETDSSSGVENKEKSAQMVHAWWHVRLWAATAMLWVLATLCAELVQPVSRRFCNASYVLWVAAVALTQLSFAALASVVVAVATGELRPQCVVAEGLSRNQLAAFLLANVLTGAVNLSIDTMHAGAGVATGVMVAYCGAWGCTGLWVKHLKRLLRAKTRTE